ncbi:MAG: alanine dehydrogenase [Hyphomicrobiaceae bacterium]
MLVGVPKEIKPNEFRVGLTPAAVREYAAHGHRLLAETGCGEGIGAADDAYARAGAEIVGTSDEVFTRADMIVKVKEPQAQEWRRLREGQILFTYLHLAPDRAQTDGLLKSGCTAVAYETVTDAHGGLPLLAPMSEVAGRLSIEAAGAVLRRTTGGRGLLVGGVPGVEPARIAIIGGGVVGTHAARMAVGLGADVVVLDRSLVRLRQLDELFGGRCRTRYSTIEAIDHEVAAADAIIGAVLVPGARAPKLVTRAMLKTMKPNASVVDVAIDQGGCFETSRPTTHEDPTFRIDGIIHYCVANMPGAVPVTSSHALNNATLRYGLALADGGLRALTEDPYLRAGLNVHRGAITYPAVAEAHGLPYSAPEQALAAL